MEQSILISTKKILGVDESYDAFDLDIITHINTAFSSLHQLGIGPTNGFMIEDDVPVWADYTQNDPALNPVRSLVFLKVKMLFDPPTTVYTKEAMISQIGELEFRLSINREENEWEDPNPQPATNHH